MMWKSIMVESIFDKFITSGTFKFNEFVVTENGITPIPSYGNYTMKWMHDMLENPFDKNWFKFDVHDNWDQYYIGYVRDVLTYDYGKIFREEVVETPEITQLKEEFKVMCEHINDLFILIENSK